MRIFITGANRGIGLEFVKQYLARGEQVFAACRQPGTAAHLVALKEQHPDRLTIVPLEVTDSQSRDSAKQAVKALTPTLDLLVNNAAIRNSLPGVLNPGIGQFRDEDLVRVFETNTIAPLLLVESFLDLLEGGNQPKIINLSSTLGSLSARPGFYRYSYGASKAALNMFTKLLAMDLKDKGIMVLSLHPGHVDTGYPGPRPPLKPPESVVGMVKVIDKLTPRQSGSFLDWRGRKVPW